VVTILFFAQLREQLGCEKTQAEIKLPISVSELREVLVNKHPDWKQFLGNEKLLFSVNKVLVKAPYLVNNGDEVAFFPPVTGG